MLTTSHNSISQTATDEVTETFPSDEEIAARVLEIRRGWNLNERIGRREEAELRFTKLIDRLTESVAA